MSGRADGAGVRLTELPNGARIATDRMESVESVSLGAWFGVGARHEKAEVNGVAHLLEHMAFKGTRRRGAADIAEEIEAVGGHLNAYTSREQTAYYAKVLKEDTGLAVDILGDILRHSVFDEEELARERGVVLQEIGLAADTPDDAIFDLFQETAFPGQALGRPVLGRAEAVGAMPRRAIVDFVDAHYGGDRLVFAAAGKVDHDALAEEVAERFGGLPERRPGPVEPARYAGGEARRERDLEQVHLVLGFRAAAFGDPGFYAQQVFSMLLGGGMSSRLFQEIRERRGLVYSIYSFASSWMDSGLLGVYAGAGEAETAELVPAVCGELARMAEDVREEEVARARAQLKSGLLMSREGTSNRCEQMAQHLLVYGRVVGVDEIVARVEAIDAAAVRAVCRETLSGPPTLAAIGPLSRLEPYERVRERLR